MASRCDVCGKAVRIGRQVSHSNIKTPRRWLPNVQRVKALVGGTAKRLYVCTSCLRSGRVKRAQ